MQRTFLLLFLFAAAGTRAPFPTCAPVSLAQGWTKIGTDGANSLIKSGACPTSYDPSIYASGFMSSEGCKAVVGAWSGGTLRTGTNQLLLFGGGHADYGGNEIYAVNFSLNPATTTRIFGPTLPGVASCFGSKIRGLGNGCAEGTTAPNSRHTYGGITYIPANSDASGTNHEQMFIWGGSLASQGGTAGNDAWMYDFSAGTWDRRDTGWTVTSAAPADGLSNSIQWDATDKAVYMLGTGTFGVYNPSLTTSTTTASGIVGANTYKTLNNNMAGRTTQYGAIDATHRKFVTIGCAGLSNCSASIILEYDLATGAESSDFFSGSGCPLIVSGDHFGATWDSKTSQVVFYSQNDNSIYPYDQPTHTCSKETYSGTVPSGSVAKGPFGRFQYVPGKDYYVLMNDAGQAPYALCRKTGGCTR